MARYRVSIEATITVAVDADDEHHAESLAFMVLETRPRAGDTVEWGDMNVVETEEIEE